jgi:hypothetical protein
MLPTALFLILPELMALILPLMRVHRNIFLVNLLGYTFGFSAFL